MTFTARPVSERAAAKAWDGVRRRAVAACAAHGAELTSLREALLAELWEAGTPLGAYELSSRLGDRNGRRMAANTVYRIMELFQTIGLVRRVESKHAYCLVGASGDTSDILLMCDTCGDVTAIGNGEIRTAIASRSEAAGFHPTRQVVEVAGRCHDCDTAQMPHD